ncbi:autophagy-related protein 11-domain-containing protein [Neurospora tetraspora]|uniref:Autophagy-related protein 11 n=1 Tax=Neurospora tetraspora TaxID=94610 RepID=A0AAE0J0K1_9PEZI|nr:autophagy-related protein 11-domain-containing protein [Neurospora tetraspora]
MVTQVLIAHTGQRLEIDSRTITSLDGLKESVASQSSIPVECLIALTPQGRSLRWQPTQPETEIYIYDSRLTQRPQPGASLPPISELPLPRYNALNPPNSIEDTRSIPAWQKLFETRRAWAFDVVEDCARMDAATRERYAEMDVMLRCLDAAVANLENAVKGLENKYVELKEWSTSAHADYNALATGLDRYLSLARGIAISSSMAQFMTCRDDGGWKGHPQRQSTLEDLVDLELARQAGKLAPPALRKFKDRITNLDKAATRLFQDADTLMHKFEATMSRSALSHDGESSHLLQDIEALANKIDNDYHVTLEYTSSIRDTLLQVSKTAAHHTERLLPSIQKRALEMGDMLCYATKARNSLAAESIEFMRSITEITSDSHSVKSQISGAGQEDELATFDHLRLIQQIPYLYASFVAEAIKRREWLDKVKQDSTTLANEMAVFHEEEAKRRRRWHKSIGAIFGPETPTADSKVPSLEINLRGDDGEWPLMTRKDLDDFFNALRNQKADPDLVVEIEKLIADMDNPTRQQSRRMKAFKNGSVHETALGRSGLLVRGDDDLLRSLQADKTRLESKLKTAESRVRRLEDLLHRQTQASRPNIGNLFQNPSQQVLDRNDSTSSLRPPRVNDDRRGSSDGLETLLQRTQQLETELNTERERCAALEREINALTTLHNDLKGQMDEANSTKKDLLQNMEALKREFTEERKSLEEEVKQLKARLEYTEDEIEHFGESRENEKASYDEKVHFLELEVERLTRERRDESLKADGQVEFLRNEARLQRERIAAQDIELRAAQDEIRVLNKRLEAVSEDKQKHRLALEDIWERLAPADAVPIELPDLLEGITGKAADILNTKQGVEGDMSLMKLNVDTLQNDIRTLRSEMESTKGRLMSEESVSLRLREKLSEERAKVVAMEGELAHGREQLCELRVKIADGETGSDFMRKKLEDEEQKLASVTEELAARQSQVQSLEEEVTHFKAKLHQTQTQLSELSTRFDARTECAKDLTQHLWSQNDCLTRLLERLGFSISREEDGTMHVQKIPRSERSLATTANPNESDPSSSLRRSTTLNARPVTDNADLELLQWMSSATPEAELEKYKTFMGSFGSFDMDVFTDAVYRRVKDVEHMARKLQREARAYREKAHSFQKEAHDKIAFKHFKEGDLALFLPTRNQSTGAWAAFNVGFPHYFLREQDSHRLRNREWLVARIMRIQERVVDLSKSLQHDQVGETRKDGARGETESLDDDENDNPFDLSDGLRWYLIEAVEDKSGAPSTPGLAKSTVAANNVEAMADMRTQGHTGSRARGLTGRGGTPSGIEGVSKTLSKSLESRRSSTGSRKTLPFAIGASSRGRESALASETNSLRAVPADNNSSAPSSAAQQHMSPTDKIPDASLQEAPQQTNAISAEGGSGTMAAGSDQATLQPSQSHSEVRNEIDSLIGP